MSDNLVAEDFIKRWETFYGESRTEKIIKNLKQKDQRILVPNSLRTDQDSLKLQLESKGFKLEPTTEFNGLIITYEPFNIVATPEYLSGMFSIQALSSLIPPRCLHPSPKSLVADLTASPGIKTSFLAQQMDNKGTILAIEKSTSRIPALKANLARMGVWNTIILNFDANLFSKLDIPVDHILLDAPCSGTGLKLAKNKRLRPRILKDIFRLAKHQETLLETAWQRLKPNGSLVYSTCSLEPEEGEVQIDNFLKRHEDEVNLLPIPLNIGSPGNKTNWKTPLHPQMAKTKRIFPKLGYDGFFTALMKKCE
ncbi:MAG: RsmB/NOP family class I SAM-dependent RNA methyltransferase [Candidatus Heimdallarchaeota archaeon]|nr:MAG: RsmB/NOP family class I SAM-dependent RNA methyltransferase [Candidatus Heimdallarchaeota archaeon]